MDGEKLVVMTAIRKNRDSIYLSSILCYPDDLKEIRKNQNPWSLDKCKFGHLHGMDSKMDNGGVFGGKKLKKQK